ncbi:MAG: protease pro-enzyme activation domain-containing protein [Polyangiaceae bacterium]
MTKHHGFKAMRNSIWLAISAGLALVLLGVVSCSSSPSDEATTLRSAIVSSASLQLKVVTASCPANQVQDIFQIVNTGSTGVKLSDIKIKFWASDSSGQAIVPQVNTGGCASGANNNPSCVHQVTGVSAAATSFAPACGPDANHQANWEVTLSTTDSAILPAGATWNNIQAAVHLANYANFTPGTSKWFSGCLPGTAFTADTHFAVYYQGNLVYANGINPPLCRAPQGQRPIAGVRTPAIINAPFVRPVPPTTPITISLSLPVRAPAGFPTLADFVSEVSDPASPQYRHYLSQADFTSRYAPTAADYQAIVLWAQSAGFTVQTVPTRMVVSATAPASKVNQALYVNLNYYQRPDGSVFYAPDRDPSIDLPTPLVEIGALQNYIARRPATVVTDWGINRLYNGGYGLGDGAYGFGEGECVGLYGGEGFSLADLTTINANRTVYTAHPELVKPTFRAVLLNSSFVAGQPAPLGCSDGTLCGPNPECPAATPNCCMTTDLGDLRTRIVESTCVAACAPDAGTTTTGSTCPSGAGLAAEEMALDVDMAMTLAPGLKEVVVYEGGTTDTTLAQMAADPALCRQFSSSWSLGVEPRTVQLLQQLAAQGQAFSVASGDDGAVGDQWHIGRLAEVTVVGGTILTGTSRPTDATIFDYTSEIPWPQSGSFIADGSSGLPAIPIPSYQQGLNLSFCASGPFCNGSTQFRNVPDVAMLASDMQIRFNGAFTSTGGTSVSSPLWASFLAVANAYGKKNGLLPLGFVNPALYAIGKTRGHVPGDLYTDAFHDLASGDTTKAFTPACGLNHDCAPPKHVAAAAWPAVAGYDLASGWGSPTPKLIDALMPKPLAPVVSVAGGALYSCAVRSDGTVHCWGDNSSGQLGDGTMTQRNSPVKVPLTIRALQVTTGGAHTCALLADQTVSCWGSNSDGELGNGTTGFPVLSPAPVQGLTGVTAIGSGESFNCALVAGGNVWCWGDNVAGNLGDGTVVDRPLPVQVPGLTGVQSIAVGGIHVCALMTGGTVSCWGWNFAGQLGDGTTTDRHSPTTVPGLAVVTSLTAGGDFNCAILQSGPVLCWGLNALGQLGDGTTTTRGVPAVVPGLANVRTIFSGDESDHACALFITGGVSCWGANHDGEVGDGTTSLSKLSPVPVQGLGGTVTSLGMSAHASCAVLASGDLKCWGNNAEGQLGIGDTTSPHPLPVTVNP